MPLMSEDGLKQCLRCKFEKVGILTKQALEATTDAGVSIGSSLAKGEEVTATGVLADVVGGKVGGKIGGKAVAKQGAKKGAQGQGGTSRSR